MDPWSMFCPHPFIGEVMLPFIHKGKAAYRFHMQKSQNLEVITVHRYLVADVIHTLMAGQPNNYY